MGTFVSSHGLSTLRAKRPLVHNITNQVVMGFTANALAALGASPLMAHAEEEVAELASVADVLVVNIGTLDAPTVHAMTLAVRAARARGRPWLLDPVGAGATAYRTRTALALLEHGPSIVRGNAAEIVALAGHGAALQRGVDGEASAELAIEAARALGARFGAVVAVTGAVDHVVGSGVARVSGGHPDVQRVVGTGCATTALMGAWAAIAPAEVAAKLALTTVKRATERATKVPAGGRAWGPGTLATRLIDALAELEDTDLA